MRKVWIFTGLLLVLFNVAHAAHELTLEDRQMLMEKADFYRRLAVEQMELATGPLNQVCHGGKRSAAKGAILGAIPGILAQTPKATWMGALLGALTSIFGDTWDCYYEAREHIDRAEYYCDLSEQLYQYLEEDYQRQIANDI